MVRRGTWLLVWLLSGCDRLLGLDGISPVGAGGMAPWVAVAAGAQHTCGLRGDGSLWCWGDNSAAQGALGSVFEVAVPTRVGAAAYASIASSADFTCAIQPDHSLWCWGRSDDGETGTGGRGMIAANERVGFYIYETPEPAQVEGSWQAVSAGGHFACGIRDDGTLWCWGKNDYGQLADPTLGIDHPSPLQVGTDATWTQIAAGGYHACGVRGDGSLWCWGHDSEGQIGTGSVADGTAIAPSQVTATGVASWGSVAIGNRTTCALPAADASVGSRVYCWGSGYGNLPAPVTLLGGQFDEVIELAAGGGDNPLTYAYDICALRVDHSLWCWGDNAHGQLGPVAASMDASAEPVPLMGGAASWHAAAVGYQHTCALGDDSSLWCVGTDARGQLGDGGGNQRVPLQVPGTWSGPSAGQLTTCALDASHHPSCAGWSGHGQIGDGTRDDREAFVPIIGGAASKQLAVGAYHACALATDGKLWCWGYDGYGELGDGAAGEIYVPEQVIATTYSSLTATDHTCAIDSTTGNIACWGDNNWGQLGTGDTNSQATPQPLNPASTFSAVAAGGAHTCAVGSAGTVCWGEDNYGQLGNNVYATPYYSTKPQAVVGPAFVSLAAGDLHTCGIDGNGGGWCWGAGDSGQLGIGGLGSVFLPRPIPGTWRELAAGGSHSCGIASNGSLWCWGGNAYGQLGDGTFEARDTPARVGSDTRWTEVTTGGSHTCATRDDATLWCWGNNDYGQLGTSTAWLAQPVLIP